MANKPGAFDLRCNEAVLSAFLCNPSYYTQTRLINMGRQMVTRGNWAFVYYLSRSVAEESLMGILPEIARKQQSTGLWFRNNAPIHSYLILRALKHSGLLERQHSEILRYDPFQWFRMDNGEYGFLVRRNIIKEPRPDDAQRQRTLLTQVAELQQSDGSWGGVVSATALQLERLMELGIGQEERVIQNGVKWLLQQYRPSVALRRPGVSWTVSMEHVFTTEDYGNEFHGAQAMLQQMKLTASCFGCLPMIQTAIALRVLSKLGYHGEERVASSFCSLFELQVKDEDIKGLVGNASCGDWCAHKCRFKLEEQKKCRNNRGTWLLIHDPTDKKWKPRAISARKQRAANRKTHPTR